MGVWDELGDPAHHEALLTHPAHADLARYVREHLDQIRASLSRENLRQPQESLFWTLLDAEQRFQAARKRWKKTGKDEFEVKFWRSAVAQYRTLGDAIAWRFLDCERQQILLLGRNPHPGLMIGKAGTEDEWQLFNEHWDAGEPTLLCALTRCITATDLIVNDTPHSARLIEVKRNPKNKDPKQQAALKEVFETLTAEPCFTLDGEPACFLRSDVPMETHWPDAGNAIREALTVGASVWVPNPSVKVLFLAPGRARFGSDEAIAAYMQQLADTAEPMLARRRHQLFANSFELPYRVTKTAPLSIFPVDVEHAAMLVSGELIFASTVGVDYYVEQLSAAGVDAEIALPARHGELAASDVVLRIKARSGGGVLRSGVGQTWGFELVKPETWAKAIATAPEPASSPRKWAAELCLANEAAAWAC